MTYLYKAEIRGTGVEIIGIRDHAPLIAWFEAESSADAIRCVSRVSPAFAVTHEIMLYRCLNGRPTAEVLERTCAPGEIW